MSDSRSACLAGWILHWGGAGTIIFILPDFKP